MPASLRRRLVSGGAATTILLCWLAPAALTFGGSVASIDRTFAFIGIGLGIVNAAAAYASRDLLGRPLGVAMLSVSLVTVVLPVAEASAFADAQNRRAAFAEARRHYEARFAQILNGPTIADVAAAVGDVGAWRLLGGGIAPIEDADERFEQREGLFDLAGQSVRFALVAQCTADFDGAQLTGGASLFGRRDSNGNTDEYRNVDFPLVPCDGQLHVAQSEAVDLPEWDAATLAGVRSGSWEVVWFFPLVTGSRPPSREASPFADYGERWLLFAAPEPAPPIAPLLEAGTPRLDPLRPR